jgi:RNA polymerase sigma-70 factor (ECF subfamily)
LATKRHIDAAREKSLLEQSKRKDLDAFGRIVDAYQARVLGFARRMLRNEEDALDVTQEVFIRAFQNLSSFDGRASLRSWLFTIAHNLCVDRARRAGRQPLSYSLDSPIEDEEPIEFSDDRWNPASLLTEGELTQMVETALDSMSVKLKTVLLLHDKEDMGYEEIAQTVNIPVGTVKSRLFLARAHLQKAVGPYLQAR